MYIHIYIIFPFGLIWLPPKSKHHIIKTPTQHQVCMKIPLLSCWPGSFKRLSEHTDYFYCPWLLPGDGS